MNQVQVACSCGRKYWPNQKWAHEGCAINRVMSECVANMDMANKDVANASNKTYRYRDAEKRRAYQREYMRKKRASS